MTKTCLNKPAPHTLMNTFSREILQEKLNAETFERRTISFYRYVYQDNLTTFRDSLYQEWSKLGVLGRVYLASEGINAQVSVPIPKYDSFLSSLYRLYPNIPVKEAVQEAAQEVAHPRNSFLKLIVRLKQKILADGMADDSYDVANVGQHLTASEFNAAMDLPGTVVVDVRNHYESEIGHFQGAILPDVDSFREELPIIKEMLAHKEDKKILLYCTGGIRCEKTSAWLRDQGFKDVNQLHGGIIDYAKQVQEQGLDNKFVGKNFVFDARMGERITEDVIARCHQCGTPADFHRNCAWQVCHILFIQCEECAVKMLKCCSPECRDFSTLPENDQIRLRKEALPKTAGFFRSKRRPDSTVRCVP